MPPIGKPLGFIKGRLIHRKCHQELEKTFLGVLHSPGKRKPSDSTILRRRGLQTNLPIYRNVYEIEHFGLSLLGGSD
jgi:hypothetical protein